MSGVGKMQEPSMDDIIRSIRNIIADDGVSAAPVTRVQPKVVPRPTGQTAPVYRLSEQQIAAPSNSPVTAANVPAADVPAAPAPMAAPVAVAATPVKNDVASLTERIAAVLGEAPRSLAEPAPPVATSSPAPVMTSAVPASAPVSSAAPVVAPVVAEEIEPQEPTVVAVGHDSDPVERLLLDDTDPMQGRDDGNGIDTAEILDRVADAIKQADASADGLDPQAAPAVAEVQAGGDDVSPTEAEDGTALTAEPVMQTGVPEPERPVAALSVPVPAPSIATAALAAETVEISVETPASSEAETVPATPQVAKADASTVTAVASATSEALVGEVKEPAKPASRAGESGRTLEESVREMLRPMIREWLEANMPRIIERAIAEEVDSRKS